ncbi:hypothetical protein GGF32_006403 [Allomyces javanicus]|nr:hypothetical protein GGF32_006403 [Allomyces javanicus]
MDHADSPASDDEYTRFFASEPAPAHLSAVAAQVEAFVAHQRAVGRRTVLVTSGGTTVPLEANTVRFLDNFSAGTRGATSAEHFLEAGYAVLFLHRQYSLRPFSRHYTHTKDSIFGVLEATADGQVQVNAEHAAFAHAVLTKHHAAMARKALLQIEFTTVVEYLYLLQAIATRMAASLGANAIYYLAAAVSDFYLPRARLAEHKIQSAGAKGLDVRLDPVPKFLVPLVRDWAADGFVVSFKLETDPALLDSKSRAALARYGHQLVIANQLSTRKRVVYLVGHGGDAVHDRAENAARADSAPFRALHLPADLETQGVDIESLMVPELVRMHDAWIAAAATAAKAADGEASE